MSNRHGRAVAKMLLAAEGLFAERDELTDFVVIIERAEAGEARISVELGRGETLLDAIEDAMCVDEEGEDCMEEYGLVLHLAAAFAEDGDAVMDTLKGILSGDGPEPDDDGEDAEDDDEDDEDDPSGEPIEEERRSVIDLFPDKKSAGGAR